MNDEEQGNQQDTDVSKEKEEAVPKDQGMNEQQGDQQEADASKEKEEKVPKGDHEIARRSLYVECSDACRFAVWTYLFADLREMAEKGKFDEETAEKLQVPVAVNDMLDVLTVNMDKLEAYLGPYKDLYLSSVEEWIGRDKKAFSSGVTAQSSGIVFIDDEKRESECVYIISLVPNLKRVIVSFRGSVTPTDWLIDSQAILRDIPNPVHDLEEGQPEHVGIHHGFFDYLYGNNTSTSTAGPKGPGMKKPARRKAINNKMQTILYNASQLMAENPDFSLYTTGHSLGGALATIFACEAAASEDPRMRKPVTCISIAAPKIGNLPFRLAVEYLENHGMLHLLRVANQGDVVPLVPDVDLRCCAKGCCCSKGYINNMYRHVGPKLYLKRRGYKLFRPRPASEKKLSTYYLLELSRDAQRFVFVTLVMPLLCVVGCKVGVDVYRAHSNTAYIKKLDANKDKLEKDFLDDFYAKEQPGKDKR